MCVRPVSISQRRISPNEATALIIPLSLALPNQALLSVSMVTLSFPNAQLTNPLTKVEARNILLWSCVAARWGSEWFFITSSGNFGSTISNWRIGMFNNHVFRPCKINNLFLIPVYADFLRYLISDDNPRRVYIVGIVF